ANIAQEDAAALVSSVSSLMIADESLAPKVPWLGAIAQWSRPASIQGTADQHVRAQSAPQDYAVLDTPLFWAVAHALNLSEPIESTWAQLVEKVTQTTTDSTQDIFTWPEYAWALTKRFGDWLAPKVRAHADMARISLGLSPID